MQENDRLSRWERGLLVSFGIFLVIFGGIVLQRSAFLQRRHTDAGVYFRAGWAVQSGTSIYQVRDDNGWPYVSTPFLAILLAPLGDPPHGTQPDRRGYSLPYPVSVVVYYALSVAALFGAMHLLAAAIEEGTRRPSMRSPPRFGRRWWALRLAPILVCAPMIGSTLSRGQPTLFILFCLAAMAAAFMHARHALAGWWLAAAICIKVFPAYLLAYPVWRRDLRCLAACAAGLVLGLGVLPAAILGPAKTIASYREYYDLFLQPAFSGTDNLGDTNDWWNEVHGHIQSFKAVLFRLAYPDPAQRPGAIPRAFWAAHLGLSGVLTLASLLAVGWRRTPEAHAHADGGLAALLSVGVLSTAVLPMIPASRDHYFALGTILVIGLVAVAWERYGALRLSKGWMALFAAVFALQLAVQIPRVGTIEDLGNVIWAELLLWAAGTYQLWRLTHRHQHEFDLAPEPA